MAKAKSSEQKAVSLTKLIVALPSALQSFLLIVILSFGFGIIMRLVAFPGALTLETVMYGGSEGVFLIGLPALLSAFACALMKSELKLKRMLFLALVGSVVYAIFYIAALMLTRVGTGIFGSGLGVVFVGYGLVFVVWYLIARVVFGIRWYGSLLFASVQLALNVAFSLAGQSIGIWGGNEPLWILAKIYFASLVFLGAIYAIFWLINAPMKRAYGVSSVDAVSLFLAQWFEHSRGLESLLESVGEKIDTLVGVLAFRAKSKLKCAFVVPYVHFGPFGNLGGSDFPYLISSEFARRWRAPAFVFHGTVTHDFNPSASAEVYKIYNACDAALRNMKFEKAKGSIATGRFGTCRAECLRIGEDAFIGLSRAPRTTEDIDFSLGLALMKTAEAGGARSAIVADAHNAETGEITRVESGNPIGFEYMEAVRRAMAAKSEGAPIKLGIAQDNMAEFFGAGVGRAGLKCAVFEFGKKNYALVLLDANGITPVFRREVLDALRSDGFDECEIFTTDSHSVNVVSGVLNPVGNKMKDVIIARILACAKEARMDVETVECGARIEKVSGLSVFGAKQSSELIGTVNAIVAITRILVPLILIASVFIVLWGITKI